MEKRKQTVIKLAQTALLAALCFVSFTFFQIKIPMPGGGDATSLHIGNAFCVLAALLLGGGYGGLAGALGMTIADILDPVYIVGAPDATSLHIGNAFCVLAALLLGGGYGGLAGALGMTIADILDPVYIVGAPKTFVLKFCIGLIVGLVAHRIAKINESTDKKYIFRWSVIASIAGLGFNVVADPLVGYFYKQYILGQPQEMAEVLAKWSTATTFVNAMAEVLAKWSTATTFVNAVVSTILVAVLYNVLRPILLKTGLLIIENEASKIQI